MRKTKSIMKVVAAGTLATVAMSGAAYAQSADALIDKLVEKGVLSVKEGNQLREESDKEFSKAFSVKSGMPDWVTALKINGDFRGRYEGIFQDKDNQGPGAFTSDRERFRYRLRLGFVANMSDQFEVGLRLASGDGASGNVDPLSTNTTLGNNGTKKGINLDLAYGKWTPKEWFQVEIGKMNNAFWMSDMVFDGDYTPEGAQARVKYQFSDKQSVGWNTGVFVLQENFAGTGGAAQNADVYAFLNQVDWTALWTPKISSRVAVGMINIKNQKASSLSAAPASNNSNGNQAFGLTAAGPLMTPVIGRAELTYNLDSFPLFTGAFPITAGAEYVNNVSCGGNKQNAYNLGIQFGSAKTPGNWQLAYNYKEIGLNSVWAGWNDSDFGIRGSGGTDVRGHVVKLQYKVKPALTLGLAGLWTEKITLAAPAKEAQTRVQADVVWAF